MQTIPFSPNNNQPFQFQCVLGGESATVFVPFNHYSNRYYVKIKDSSGRAKVFMPLIASPDDSDINLALPFGGGALVYRASLNQFEAR